MAQSNLPSVVAVDYKEGTTWVCFRLLAKEVVFFTTTERNRTGIIGMPRGNGCSNLAIESQGVESFARFPYCGLDAFFSAALRSFVIDFTGRVEGTL